MTYLPSAILLMGTCLYSCIPDMQDQASKKPFEKIDFFKGDSSYREPVPGSVAQNALPINEALNSGEIAGKSINFYPLSVTKDLVFRGKNRYEIFCTPCHGFVGEGDGMVVQRGFVSPVSFHSQVNKTRSLGELFGIIKNGFFPMPAFKTQLSDQDRWAIIAYIEALRLSQNIEEKRVPNFEQKLDAQNRARKTADD